MDAIYVAFHADWQDPPGTVVKTFRTLSEAEGFCHDEMDGYGYSVVTVPFPSDAHCPVDGCDEGEHGFVKIDIGTGRLVHLYGDGA